MFDQDLYANPSPAPLRDDRLLPFTMDISTAGDERVVAVSGELDIDTRSEFQQACLGSDHRSVVVEMSSMTFMDCGGYAAFVIARRVLGNRGGSLTMQNQTGQPARFIQLLTGLGIAA